MSKPFTRLGLLGLVTLAACRGAGFEVPPAWHLGGQTSAYHMGPLVAAGNTGPGRFVEPLLHWFAEQGDVADSTWQVLESGENGFVWRMAGSSSRAAECVVLYADQGSLAGESLVRGARAWERARSAGQVSQPKRDILLVVGHPDMLAAHLAEGEQPLAHLSLLAPVTGPCTLWLTPGPDTGGEPAQASGLNLLLRLSLVDVGLLCRPWKSVEYHQDSASGQWPHVALAIGESGVDLSRSDKPNADEATRASVALWSAASALAEARPSDLKRYLDTFSLESRLRHFEAQGDSDREKAWKEWLRGARFWMRAVTLDL